MIVDTICETYARFEEVPFDKPIGVTLPDEAKALVAEVNPWAVPVPERLRWANLMPGIWDVSIRWPRLVFPHYAEEHIEKILACCTHDQQQAARNLIASAASHDDEGVWALNRRAAGLYADALIAHILAERPRMFPDSYLWVRWQSGRKEDIEDEPVLSVFILSTEWEPPAGRRLPKEEVDSMTTYTLMNRWHLQVKGPTLWERLARD